MPEPLERVGNERLACTSPPCIAVATFRLWSVPRAPYARGLNSADAGAKAPRDSPESDRCSSGLRAVRDLAHQSAAHELAYSIGRTRPGNSRWRPVHVYLVAPDVPRSRHFSRALLAAFRREHVAVPGQGRTWESDERHRDVADDPASVLARSVRGARH